MLDKAAEIMRTGRNPDVVDQLAALPTEAQSGYAEVPSARRG